MDKLREALQACLAAMVKVGGDMEPSRYFADLAPAIDLARAALAEPVADEPVALNVCLDEEATRLLHDTMVPEPGEVSAIRLQVGEGHEGHGLYVSLAEYPEEGSIFLAAVPACTAAAPAERGEYPQELSDAALDSIIDHYWGQSGRALPLYPAHRAFARAVLDADRAQRVPLTDEQIDEIVCAHAGYGHGDFRSCVRAAERAHGIGAKP